MLLDMIRSVQAGLFQVPHVAQGLQRLQGEGGAHAPPQEALHLTEKVRIHPHAPLSMLTSWYSMRANPTLTRCFAERCKQEV